MPAVASVAALLRAATEFATGDLNAVAQPAALEAARRSLTSSGLLLVGEVREVRVRYEGGAFYNCEPRRFSRAGRSGTPLLAMRWDRMLLLTLPLATEAVVPHRPSSQSVRQIS